MDSGEEIFYAWKCKHCQRWCSACDDICLCGRTKPSKPRAKISDLLNKPVLVPMEILEQCLRARDAQPPENNFFELIHLPDVNIPQDGNQYIPQEENQYIPQDENQYIPQDGNQYIPQDESQYIPQDESQYIPQDENQYIPQEENQYIPQDGNQYIPQDGNQYIPQDGNQYIPQEENQYMMITHSRDSSTKHGPAPGDGHPMSLQASLGGMLSLLAAATRLYGSIIAQERVTGYAQGLGFTSA
ncbi:hypothetical protein F4774DRAFT_421727 [Daldinia eschscholtzii]|nr:hypothetical protein F4774DRAFT_421727 [Daldinia eschscholtzii]